MRSFLLLAVVVGSSYAQLEGNRVTNCPHTGNQCGGGSYGFGGSHSALQAGASPVCVGGSGEVEVAVQCCRSGTVVEPPLPEGEGDGGPVLDFQGYPHSECVASNIALEEGDACDSYDSSSTKPNFDHVGWATLDGGYQPGGTTGGVGGDEVTVSTGIELQAAISDAEGPRIIYVDGVITQNNSDNSRIIMPGDIDRIFIRERGDLSIIGVGTNGELDGIGIYLRNASNIVIRNLYIHNVVEGEGDCITVDDSQHIWIDHCELHNELQGVDRDYYDGLLDTRRRSEYLTYSWNYLHDGWKVALTGSNSADTHDRRVTWHHNRFSNVEQRLPFIRGGRAHVYNNLYEDVIHSAVNSRLEACVKVENNYFVNAHDPWGAHYSAVPGDVDTSGNVLVYNSSFTNDTRPAGECTLSIPYAYEADSARVARTLILEYAGVGVVSGNGVGLLGASGRGRGRGRLQANARCGASEQCFATVSTVAEAEEFCANLRIYPETPEDVSEGWSLCTVDEIEGGACCDVPCRSSNDRIVTSDVCELPEDETASE